MLTHLAPAKAWHAVAVAETIRPEDAAEIQAMAGLPPLEGLVEAVAWSSVCFAMMADDQPVALYGARQVLPGIGVVWMIAGTGILKHTTQFLRSSVEYTNRLHDEIGCDTLANYTDKRNTLHHKWLRFTGFSFGKEVITGHEQRPFYEITRTRFPCAP
jgi:hypothetical protein